MKDKPIRISRLHRIDLIVSKDDNRIMLLIGNRDYALTIPNAKALAAQLLEVTK
jgi:hypothetical protein